VSRLLSTFIAAPSLWAAAAPTLAETGSGTLAGIGNGNPLDASSFQSGIRKTFQGRVVAAIRAATEAGAIDVDIDADALPARRV